MDRSKKQLLYSNVFIKPDFISLYEREFFFSVATGAQREGDTRSFTPPRSGTTGRPRPPRSLGLGKEHIRLKISALFSRLAGARTAPVALDVFLIFERHAESVTERG